MNIEELHLKNFGKFSDRKISFNPGINLIYGENESGKTTLHTFIKSGFYGIRKSRGRGAGKDIFHRYEPWENPSYYAGNIRFQCGEKIFRLERDFQNPQGRDMLVCETDGERLSLEYGDLDMLMGDVGEVVFENTVFISQMKSRTEDGLAAELKNYMANCQDGDGSVNVQESVQFLKSQKKEQERQIQAKLKKQEERKEKLFSKLQYVQEDLQKLKEEYKNVCQEMEKESQDKNGEAQEGNNLPEAESGDEKNDDFRYEDIGEEEPLLKWKDRMRAVAVLVIAGILLILLSYWDGNEPSVKMLIVAAAAIAYAAVILIHGVWTSMKGREEQILEEKIPQAPKKEDTDSLRWSAGRLEKEIHEKQLQAENLQEEINRLTDEDNREERRNIEAIQLAMDYIEETVADMQVYMGKRLKDRTSEILSELTDGKYTAVELDEDFQPGVHTASQYVPLEQLSRGTMEQVYFALRMASGEILCQEEVLPVILDDVFAMYDEERLGRTLHWLAMQNRQVLIFTCHKREEELLKQLGIVYNKVQM